MKKCSVDGSLEGKLGGWRWELGRCGGGTRIQGLVIFIYRGKGRGKGGEGGGKLRPCIRNFSPCTDQQTVTHPFLHILLLKTQ
jgi:hypothetical protein